MDVINRLSEVFSDISGHKQISKIIREYSSNKTDIRNIALEGLDIANINQVIDVGCGFGFFSEAFCQRSKPETTISGIDRFEEYRNDYLQRCSKYCSDAMFYNEGQKALAKFKTKSIDLILCSFALYFFPFILPQFCKLLKKSGTCIFITHSKSHLNELIQLILRTIYLNDYTNIKTLPHDELINNFSGENGEKGLSKYFDKIEKRNYFNELVFTIDSIGEFIQYFRYKKSFFFPGSIIENQKLIRQVEGELINYVKTHKKIKIKKNDVIFICSKPKLNE